MERTDALLKDYAHFESDGQKIEERKAREAKAVRGEDSKESTSLSQLLPLNEYSCATKEVVYEPRVLHCTHDPKILLPTVRTYEGGIEHVSVGLGLFWKDIELNKLSEKLRIEHAPRAILASIPTAIEQALEAWLQQMERGFSKPSASEKLLFILAALAFLLATYGLFNHRRFTHNYSSRLRPPCLSMPWTTWPALVVLWGVCWMFYPGPSSPLSGEDDFENVALSNSGITLLDISINDQNWGLDYLSGLDYVGLAIEPSLLNSDDSYSAQISTEARLSNDPIEARLNPPQEQTSWDQTQIHQFRDFDSIHWIPAAFSSDATIPHQSLMARSLEAGNKQPANPADQLTLLLEIEPQGLSASPPPPIDPNRQFHSSSKSKSPESPASTSTKQKRYKCDQADCHQTFSRPSDLTRHKNTIHLKRTLFPCPEPTCKHASGDTPFLRKDHLAQHLKRKNHSAANDAVTSPRPTATRGETSEAPIGSKVKGKRRKRSLEDTLLASLTNEDRIRRLEAELEELRREIRRKGHSNATHGESE
ncbi:hypothetical protein MMC10_002271 [Thelotrema lepadinum]|nr:hypothetical protein [Thelotrema lepadinum]